ncbi:MAG: single-stranded-DNA-specific exonuclease RecJ, partial [Phycisphaerae bacterium]|nr:single-stranded-DNA-specific exonuclease RecJ [Phycisphaerae bacterium]
MSTHTSIRGELKRWRIAAPDPRADELARRLRIGPLTAQVLCRRDITEEPAAQAFLAPSLNQLHDPVRLPGAKRAADRLVEAVRGQQKIVIYGDYDVDGISASAILYHVIKAADPATDVRCYVPHRLEEGYGLNGEAIGTLASEGTELIVSVDCGITATGPADLAREKGMDLIITDHHEMDAELPAAHTLVHPRLPAGTNPNDPTDPYPFADLCGAGVAYKLAWQFARAWCGSDQVTQTFRQTLVNLLPLAALGTIADVVPLQDENRALAVFGLRHIQDTPWVGLNALIDAAALRGEAVSCYHVGFVLGPRLNACGRMGHARQAVQLLTDVGAEEAAEIAAFLNSENEDRRATERQIVEEAAEMVEARGYEQDEVRAIVLGHEDWHPGVVGIVCSRLVERFGRPTVLLNTAGQIAQGSARSIDAFNIHQALVACNRHLNSFGGHAMAAGLKLPVERIDAFRQ